MSLDGAGKLFLFTFLELDDKKILTVVLFDDQPHRICKKRAYQRYEILVQI